MKMHQTCKDILRPALAAAFLWVACVTLAAAQTAPASSVDKAPSGAAPAADVPVVPPLTASVPLTADAAAVKKRLEEKFAGAVVRNVAKSGVLGLYEAQFDGQMVYTDQKVTYILVGSIYDTSTKQNLTEERSRKLNRITWDALPFDLAMKKVKGN